MPILSVDDFRNQFAALCARYSPDLSESYDHARSALHHRSRDVSLTDNELDGIIRYCENAYFGEAEDVPATDSIEDRIAQLTLQEPSYIINYTWCEVCRKMMGGAAHQHCSSCNTAVTGTTNPCGRCRNCCDCVRCGNCGGHHPRSENMVSCATCGSCRNCCKCVPCRYEGCSTGKKVACNNCGGCRDCCQCNVATYGKPWRASRSNKRTQFDCSRLTGVEWEFNRVNNRIEMQSWVRKWRGRIHHDGSCGEEVVTPPIAGDFMVACLMELGAAFKKAGGTADNRCSIHVHVDSRDVHWNDLNRLLKAYTKYEGFLYMLAGEQRAANRYCKPCGKLYGEALKKQDWKERIIIEALADPEGRHHLRNGSAHKKANGRYRGINLCPWLVGRARKETDTTIEFRLHENTLDAKEVIYWTQLVARLVDWSTKSTDEQANNLPESALEAFSKIIAPETATWLNAKVDAFHKPFTSSPNNFSTGTIKYINGVYSLIGY